MTPVVWCVDCGDLETLLMPTACGLMIAYRSKGSTAPIKCGFRKFGVDEAVRRLKAGEHPSSLLA